MGTKNIIKRLLILQTLVFVSVSCAPDDKIRTQTPYGDHATVTFSLNVPGNSMPATRGLSESDETNIETVDLLLFRKEGDKLLYWDKVPGVSLDNAAGNIKTFKAVIESKYYRNYDITVIANGRDIISDAGLARGDIKSVALNRLTKTMPVGEKWNSGRIPMWGEARDVDIDENTNLSGENAVKMTRMIARIDIKLSRKAATGSDEITAAGNVNFALASVRLYNYSTVGTLVPDLENGWGGNPVKATAPNRPAEGYGKALYVDGYNPLLYTAGDQHATAASMPDSLIRAIYTLEAPKGSGATPETNTCLVIGGRYGGGANETYYRIDFARKDGLTHKYVYMDLLRNHRYLINIAKISGAGFETPDEAFYSSPVNIEADILEWNDGEIGDIIFDSQYYLGVSPAGFLLYKDAAADNKIIITTDVASGWKVAGITDSNRPGVGNAIDWIHDIGGSFSGPGNKDTLTFSIKENETGEERYAWIHIKAGRLNFAVKVTQNAGFDPRNYRIVITDGGGDEISELFFAGGAKGTSTPQNFNVEWFPSGSLLKATMLPDPANPLSATYNPEMEANSANMLVWEPGGLTYAVLPDAIDISSEPFFEKSVKVLFELQTPAGPMTKILTIRQTNFNLIPQIGIMLMDGKPQSFGVRANFTWKAEFVSASSKDAPSFADYDIVKTFDTQYGGNNTTVNGDPVVFTCKDFISDRNKDNPREAEVKVKFSRLDKNQWVPFETVTVPCYSAVYAAQSNCYMINNADRMSLLIPVSQVGYAMKAETSGFLGSGWISDYGRLKAQVLWSDLNKFDTADAVVKVVSYNGAADTDDGKIIMVPGSGEGNAVIILYEDNDGNGIYSPGDKIRWSWHIWNTTYHPYDASGTPRASGIGNMWMDRNLGAMSNTQGDIRAVGFYYQWGRKDPFPRPVSWNNAQSPLVYSAPGSDVTFSETGTPDVNNLPNSVLNPLTRYFLGTSPYDWFTTQAGSQNNDLWGGIGNTAFLHTGGKSVYDPCPVGYRIPANGADGWGVADNEESWQAFDNYGRINDYYGGYYPAAGGRSSSSASLNYSGNQSNSGGYYWQNKANGTSGTYLHTSRGDVKPNANSSRAYGYSVRCIRE